MRRLVVRQGEDVAPALATDVAQVKLLLGKQSYAVAPQVASKKRLSEYPAFVAYAAHGQRVHVGADAVGGLAEWAPGQPYPTTAVLKLRAWSVSDDGRWVLTRPASKGGPRLVSVVTGASVGVAGKRFAYPATESISDFSASRGERVVSPDGRWLAAATKCHLIYLWNLSTMALAVKQKGHVGDAWDIAVTPDGRTAFTAGDERGHRPAPPQGDPSVAAWAE